MINLQLYFGLHRPVSHLVPGVKLIRHFTNIALHVLICCLYLYLYEVIVFYCWAGVFVTAVGYLIFRSSNSQKNAFRQNPEYAEKKGQFCEYRMHTYLVLYRCCCVK